MYEVRDILDGIWQGAGKENDHIELGTDVCL